MKPEQRKTFLMIASAAVVGLFLLDRMVITPLSARWKEQGDRIADLQQKVQRGRQLLEREDQIRTRWADMVRADLPGENEAYKAISRWAIDSQITFTSLVPQWQMQTRDQDYDLLECRATAEGNQATIGRIIYDLETDHIPVNLEECELSTRDGHGTQVTFAARFSFLKFASEGGKKQ